MLLLVLLACTATEVSPICDAYVDCVAQVAPTSLGEAQLAFGAASECWSDPESADRCEQTCTDALTTLASTHHGVCEFPDEDTGLDPMLDYREVEVSCASRQWDFRLVTKGEPTGGNLGITQTGGDKESHTDVFDVEDLGDGLTELTASLSVASGGEEPVPGTSTAFSCDEQGSLTFLVCPASDSIYPDCVVWGDDPSAYDSFDALEWPP